MARSLIKLQQGALSPSAGVALSGATGTAVSITNGDNTGVSSWEIDILDVPGGSSVPIGILAANDNGNTPSASFTPDVRGSYRLRLQTWSVINRVGTPDVDIRVFTSPQANGFITPPYQTYPPQLPPLASGLSGAKPDEMNFSGQTRGWAGNGTDDGLLNAFIAHGGSGGASVIPTATDLRGYTGELNSLFLYKTSGYLTPTDGGGAFYRWDNSSTSTDDGVLVFQVSGTTTGRFKYVNVGNDLMFRSSCCGTAIAAGTPRVSFDPTGTVAIGSELERVTKLLSVAGYIGVTFDPTATYKSNSTEQVSQRKRFQPFILDFQGAKISADAGHLPGGANIAFFARAAGDTGTIPAVLQTTGYITDSSTTCQRKWTQTFSGAEKTMTGISNVGSHGTVPALSVGQDILLRIGACQNDAGGWSNSQYFGTITDITGSDVTVEPPLSIVPPTTGAGINVSRTQTMHDMVIIDTNGYQDYLTIKNLVLDNVTLTGMYDRWATIDCHWLTAHFCINTTGSIQPTYIFRATEVKGYNAGSDNPWYGGAITLQATHAAYIPVFYVDNLDGVYGISEELLSEGTHVDEMDVVWDAARSATDTVLIVSQTPGSTALIEVDQLTAKGGYQSASFSPNVNIVSAALISSNNTTAYNLDLSKVQRLTYQGPNETTLRSYSGRHSFDFIMPYPTAASGNPGDTAVFANPMMGIVRRLRIKPNGSMTNIGSVKVQTEGFGGFAEIVTDLSSNVGSWVNINEAENILPTLPNYYGLSRLLITAQAGMSVPTAGGYFAIEIEMFVPDIVYSDIVTEPLVTGDSSVARILAGNGVPSASASFIGQEYLDTTSSPRAWYKSVKTGTGAADWAASSATVTTSPILLAGALSGDTGGPSVAYLSNTSGTSTSSGVRYPTSARTLSKLRVTLQDNTISVPVVVTLFKNGSSTSQTITINPSDIPFTKYADTSHVVSFVDGDDFDIQMSCATDASAGTCDISVSLE